MNQEERLDYLIEAFKTDSVEYKTIQTPTALIPKCSVDGSDMTTNLRSDYSFVEDEGCLCVPNFNEAFCPEQISDRSICINGDIFDILMTIEQ